VADVAGTAIVAANTHVITPTKPFSKLVLRIVNTGAEKVITIKAGDSPPADAAGLGDLATTFAIGSSTPVVKWFAGLESARFSQDDGSIEITVAASTTGFITAFEVA